MKKLNVINIVANFFKRKKDGIKKPYKTQRNVKTAVVIVSLSASVIASGAFLVGCSQQNDELIDQPTTEIVSQLEDNQATDEESFSLFVDGIDIENLRVTDNLTEKTEQKAAEIAQAMNPGGTIYNPNDVVIKTDPATGQKEGWVSEEKAQEWENNQGVTIGKGWMGPDGNVWESEAAYNEYVNGNNQTGTVEYEDKLYWADDGTPFLTEKEKNAWNEHLKGSSIIVADGEVVNNDETEFDYSAGYKDNGYYWSGGKDGSFYVSYEAYLESLNAGNTNTNSNSSANQETSGSVYEDNLFFADDGSPFTDKAQRDEWNEYLRSQGTNAVGYSDSTIVVDDNTQTSAQYEDTLYFATDGTPFLTEREKDEWNEYLKNQNNNNNETMTFNDNTQSSSEYEDTLYFASDGTPFTDEAQKDEWNEYLNSQSSAAPMAASISEESTVAVLTEEEYQVSESETTQVENNYTYNADGYIDNETGYFYDNSGDCWGSYSDYLAYKQLLVDQEKSK